MAVCKLLAVLSLLCLKVVLMEIVYFDAGSGTCKQNIKNHRHLGLFNEVKDVCGRGWRNWTVGSQVTKRIASGEPADIGEFPWLVYIIIEHRSKWWEELLDVTTESTRFHQTGTLITKRYVMTTARKIIRRSRGTAAFMGRIRCFFSAYKFHDEIRHAKRGRDDTVAWRHDNASSCQWTDATNTSYRCDEGIMMVEVEKVIHHERATYFTNDITLLRLKKNIVFNAWIKPICLPLTCDLQTLNLTNLYMWTSGYGNLMDSNKSIPWVLQKTKLRAMEKRKCVHEMRTHKRLILNSNVCAISRWPFGTSYTTTCLGDEGAPLMLETLSDPYNSQYFFMGILGWSWFCKGNIEETRKIPTVYYRVASFLDWILDHVETGDMTYGYPYPFIAKGLEDEKHNLNERQQEDGEAILPSLVIDW